MSEWRTLTLGEVCELKRGYDLPAARREPGSVPIISSSGVSGLHSVAKVIGPGVVTGRYGSLGQVFYVEEDFWPLNTALYVRDFKGNDPGFVAALLQSMDLARYDGAAAVPGLNRNHLHTLPVQLPPFDQQVAISRVLRALDALIENNTRRIEILEAMAQAIYREWFVEFRYPGHEGVPLQDSELGLIPELWRPLSLGEVLEFHIGGGWGSEVRESHFTEPANVIRGTDIPKARRLAIGSCPDRFHTPSNLKKRLLEVGDLVLEVSGGSKGQPVGRSLLVSQALLDQFESGVICASFCKLLRSDPAVLAPEIVHLHLLRLYESGEIDAYQVQSTGITNLRFAQLIAGDRVVVPPTDVQREFLTVIQPILALAANLGIGNRVLGDSRNLLLPRLITGEVDVSGLDLDLDGLVA
jgi:type I restriction enzyme S subunit